MGLVAETVVATPVVARFVVMVTTALLIVRATAAATMEELLKALELLIRSGVSLLYVTDKVQRLAGERVMTCAVVIGGITRNYWECTSYTARRRGSIYSHPCHPSLLRR